MVELTICLISGKEITFSFDEDGMARDALGSIAMVGFCAKHENGENQFVAANMIKNIRMGNLTFPKTLLPTTEEIITQAELIS